MISIARPLGCCEGLALYIRGLGRPRDPHPTSATRDTGHPWGQPRDDPLSLGAPRRPSGTRRCRPVWRLWGAWLLSAGHTERTVDASTCWRGGRRFASRRTRQVPAVAGRAAPHIGRPTLRASAGRRALARCQGGSCLLPYRVQMHVSAQGTWAVLSYLAARLDALNDGDPNKKAICRV